MRCFAIDSDNATLEQRGAYLFSGGGRTAAAAWQTHLSGERRRQTCCAAHAGLPRGSAAP